MNGFDVALLALACVLVVFGMVKGLVRILIGLAALVAAFALAARFHEPLADRIAAWADLAVEPRRLIAYLAIFLGVMVAGGVAAWLARTLLKVAMLGWADRLAGAALGLVVAALAGALVILPVVAYSPWGPSVLSSSVLAPYVTVVADLANAVTPDDLAERYRERVDDLRDGWRGRATATAAASEV